MATVAEQLELDIEPHGAELDDAALDALAKLLCDFVEDQETK